ncbi:hypothetical protein [Gemmatimonas sp.]|uniref:hypothetical protein n=1 Tax=Gemmatimonas sp. TaxID=1962908 RepID=UPI00356A0AE8
MWAYACTEIAVFDVEGVLVATISPARLVAPKRAGRAQDIVDLSARKELRRLRAA